MTKRGGSGLVVCLSLLCLHTAAQAQDADRSWGYSTLGFPGLVEMPSAFSRDDAEFALSYSAFRNQYRTAMTFQLADRFSATFRYAGIDGLDAGSGPIETFDRSFSLHYRLLDEGRYMPAVAVGLNDVLGTGLFSGEYLVASKTVTPKVRATLGLGWGRLGSQGGFTNPLSFLGDRFKTRDTSLGDGGELNAGQWFRGDAAFFGGVEWMVNDRLRLVAEYSSDAYDREDGFAFDRKSPLNFGITWKANDQTHLSAQYLYGSEIGFQINYITNPKSSRAGGGNDPAPLPILPRTSIAAASWGDVDAAQFQDRLKTTLAREGMRLEGFETTGSTLSVTVRNDRYATAAQATGRTARVLSRLAPQNVDRFRIVLAQSGVPVTAVSLNRGDLERLEFDVAAPEKLRASTVFSDQALRLPPVAGQYPTGKINVLPFVTTSLFDPDEPLRADAGVSLKARYEPLPGLVFSARVNQKLIGNIADSDRFNNSALPPVRTNAVLYARGSDTSLRELTGAVYFRPGKDLFGRVTVGYLETMFGGISAEVLWKPQESDLAIGLEVNHVYQRDYDDIFGFQDYNVTTGHLSAYYDLGRGYQAQLDVGQYLAGDVGATVTLAREFANGWRIGAYATKTDVSAEDFGEGSFDKGITLTIPLEWGTGKPNPEALDANIRSVTRDGGARLSVQGRLYPLVRESQATQLDASWGRFWK